MSPPSSTSWSAAVPGTGKTTLLNALSSAIPDRDRIVTIEDAAELQLHQRHVLRLESRPPNIEGQGAIPIRELVRNSLRMRPDRIIVGEIRGAEALDMLQAMNTGHEGSLSTVHSNSPRDALSRVETMVLMAGYDLPVRAIRQQVASALDMVVHLARLNDGSRRVTSITEVQGMESDVITMQELFEFKIDSFDADGTISGGLRSTGLRPVFVKKFERHGIELPDGAVPRGRRDRPLDSTRSGAGHPVRRARSPSSAWPVSLAVFAAQATAAAVGTDRDRGESRRVPRPCLRADAAEAAVVQDRSGQGDRERPSGRLVCPSSRPVRRSAASRRSC